MAFARCNLVIQDEDGNIVDGASLEIVHELTGALPQLYSDRNGTTIGNPFTAADGADAGFHVVGGVYKITATLGAFSRVWRYVAVGLAAETDLTLITPAGPWDVGTNYSIGSYVTNGGYQYVSRINDNLGNVPDTTPASTTPWMFVGPAQRFEMSITMTGTAPSDAEVVEGHVFAEPMTFPAGLTGSRATCRDTASSSAVFSILKNGVQVATVTFAAGVNVGTFAMASALNVVAGDQIDLQAPSPADLTIRGIKITLRGSP